MEQRVPPSTHGESWPFQEKCAIVNNLLQIHFLGKADKGVTGCCENARSVIIVTGVSHKVTKISTDRGANRVTDQP